MESIGSALKLREALQGLFDNGLVPSPRNVAVCMPCIDDGGYSAENYFCKRCQSETKKKCVAVRDAQAALAEPPRNCDVGTAEEQAERFEEFCLKNHSAEKLCSECCLGERLGNNVDVCQIHWAQMPYEKGVEK